MGQARGRGRGVGVRTAGQRERSARLTQDEKQRAERMILARSRFDVSLDEFGTLFGTDPHQTYKLEAGLNRIRNGREVLMEVIERALERADAASPKIPPQQVWGPRELSPAERLARICVYAFPELAAKVRAA